MHIDINCAECLLSFSKLEQHFFRALRGMPAIKSIKIVDGHVLLQCIGHIEYRCSTDLRQLHHLTAMPMIINIFILLVPPDTMMPAFIDTQNNPEEWILVCEICQSFTCALEQLTPDGCRLLALRDTQEQQYDTIAAEFDITVTCAKTRVHRHFCALLLVEKRQLRLIGWL